LADAQRDHYRAPDRVEPAQSLAHQTRLHLSLAIIASGTKSLTLA
jgi:hypothetical protein